MGWERSNSGTSSHAHLAGVLSQHVDELHADRVAERLRDATHPIGGRSLDVGIDDGLAARLADRALLFRGELQIEGHLFIYIN